MNPSHTRIDSPLQILNFNSQNSLFQKMQNYVDIHVSNLI